MPGESGPEHVSLLPASPFRADSGSLALAGAALRQVFGLVGDPGRSLASGLAYWPSLPGPNTSAQCV